MKQKKKAPKWRGGYSDGQKMAFFGFVALLLVVFIAAFFLTGDSKVKETEDVCFGVDVSKYQGTVDWAAAAESGVDFAIVRIGYRGIESGEISEDSNARYNLQEASKADIKLGAYFFSTAVTKEEAEEEADFVADLLDDYPITYPVAYDCERFLEKESRQYYLTKPERTAIALAFLQRIEERGYEGMFYGSRNDMEGESQWEMSRIQDDYKVWVAQYPENPYPDTPASSYSGAHQMWQYSRSGSVAGFTGPVDVNIAYFGYSGIREAKSREVPETVAPDPEALMDFQEVREAVTAKELCNLRDIPSQDSDSRILAQLENGQEALRTGVSDTGWSRILYNGETYYAVSNLLTTNLSYSPTEALTEDDGIETVFTSVNEKVTAKELVNLRNIPSVEHEDSKVIEKLKHGDIAIRTGINNDVGWSRVEYNGQTLYCVSSYLEPAEE